jgi:hypothetical protein
VPLVECKAGYTETFVAGTQYQFNRDSHGRHVAEVENPAHLHCFLARAEMYAVVSAQPIAPVAPVQPIAADPIEQEAEPAPRRRRGRPSLQVEPGGTDGDAPGLTGASPSPEPADATLGDTPATMA